MANHRHATGRRHADVLVIGAGATGAIASLVLAEAGLDVVCLEQGGWVAPEDHPHYSRDWEWQRQKRWNANINIRKNDGDYPVETGTSNVLMWNAVGGSTNVYTALWPRYRPSDFRKGVEHGLAPDWPISYEDLAPYYDAADRLVGRQRPRRQSRPAAARCLSHAAPAAQKIEPAPGEVRSIGSAGIGGRCRRARSPRTMTAARPAMAAARASPAARAVR